MVGLGALRHAVEPAEAHCFLRDADLGHIAKKLLTHRSVERAPARRRRSGACRIIREDLLARDVDAEIHFYGLAHLRGGVKAGQGFDDELLYLMCEGRHRFLIL
jgi:hypothetical protein